MMAPFQTLFTTRSIVCTMALANELSSEIAAAILSTGQNSPAELEDLKRVVEEVHTTLEQMEDRERKARRVPKSLARTAAGDC